MIKPDMIPDEVVEAAARMLCHERHPCWSIVSEVMETDHDGQATEFRIRARASIAAALQAWPGAVWRESGVGREIVSRRIVLPLPQEARDEQ